MGQKAHFWRRGGFNTTQCIFLSFNSPNFSVIHFLDRRAYLWCRQTAPQILAIAFIKSRKSAVVSGNCGHKEVAEQCHGGGETGRCTNDHEDSPLKSSHLSKRLQRVVKIHRGSFFASFALVETLNKVPLQRFLITFNSVGNHA